jgi:hypothetical protein
MSSVQSISFFNNILPAEMQHLVFEYLPPCERFLTVPLVCKAWNALTSIHSLPIFPDFELKIRLQEGDKEYIRSQWQIFEKHIVSKNFSVQSTARILITVRELFEEGVIELHDKYTDIPQNISFSDWIKSRCDIRYVRADLFKILLTCPSVSAKLGNLLKETFLILEDPKGDLFVKALKFDAAITRGNTKFLEFLILKNPKYLLDEAIFQMLCHRCKAERNSSLIYFFLKQLSSIYGITKERRNRILKHIAQENKEARHFVDKSEDPDMQSLFPYRSIKKYIGSLRKERSNQQPKIKIKTDKVAKKCLIQ